MLRTWLVLYLKHVHPHTYMRLLVGKAADVKTQTTLAERVLLYEEARAALGKYSAVEVGSYLGASSAVLAEAMRRGSSSESGRVFCIDTWANDAMSEGKRDTRTSP